MLLLGGALAAALGSGCEAASPATSSGAGEAAALASETAALARAPAPGAPALGPLPTPAPELIKIERACMGTRCTIAALHADRAVVERAVSRALEEIARLDALMTTWTDTSEVSRINGAAGSGQATVVGPETFEVLEQALWIARLSGGAFDITVGAFKGLWKFDEDKDGSLPSRKDVLARLPLVDYRGLLLDASRRTALLQRRGQSITLGGIAKGLIVDHAVAKLRENGLHDFLVQAGGDMFASGRHGGRPWRVGIQDPRAAGGEQRSVDTSFALLELEDAAFNTSGDYERFVIEDGKRYHHILDPHTGYPVSHTRSVTVLASSSFLADTLDTAIFVLGAEKGMALLRTLPGVEAVIVDAHNQVHVTPGLSGRLQITRSPHDGI